MNKIFPIECKECGSKDLSWFCQPTNNSGGVQDGLLRMHDIGIIFVLGCNECYEDVQIISGDKVADLMNDMIKN